MTPAIALAFLVVLVALALVLALRSWRRRRAAQAGHRLPRPPAGAVPDLVAVDGLHLATTFAGRPLDRVVVAGLGFRSPARVRVGRDRVTIELAAGAVVLPAASVRGVGAATWTIDRAVEPGGLTVLAWDLEGPDGPVPVESSFRFAPEADAALRAAARSLPAATREGSA